MKRLLTLCITIALLACNKESKVDYISFSGKIENPTARTISIYQGEDIIKEITLEEDGTFKDTLKIENGYYNLGHGREIAYIYLEQGDNIKVTLDAKKFNESIKHTGIGSENNNFLVEKNLIEEKANLNFSKIFSKGENEFIAFTNELKSSKTELLKSKKNISESFRNLEQKSIDYDHLLNLQSYPANHRYFTKNENFKPSESLLNDLKVVDYNNEEDYKNFNSYKILVKNYYKDKIGNSDTPYSIFDELSKNGFAALKEDIAMELRYDISPNNKHNEDYYKGVMALSTDDKFKKDITAKYTLIKNLVKGMPSPEFVKYENHKGGTTSLKDLKGKYVYIDVWATWCGPCIREIPALKKVEKQFHGKNIEFVSTSIDKAAEHNKWVEMVKEKELGGTQLIADNDWNSKFVKDYAIEGIPRFILIDPQGNIVNADAPRPSSPKLIELFEELKI